jgi:hypothetical protein
MKIKLFFILLITINLNGYSQLNPSKVVLKTGDTITGILGKLKSKSFKYKVHPTAKAKEIDFSEIDFVQFKYSNNKISTFKFFQTTDKDRYIAVKPLVIGDVELYGDNRSVSSTGAGGIPLSQTVVDYYIKRQEESKLTTLGFWNSFTTSLKDKIIMYFKDCNKVIEKIKDKEFRMRDGLEPIVEYYNENCSSDQKTMTAADNTTSSDLN